MSELLVGCAIVFLGGLVQGCTGFGNALVIVPVLLLLMPPVQVAPLAMLLSLVNNLIILVEIRRAVEKQLVLPLFFGALIGIPVGVYLLTSLNPAAIKLGVGLIVVLLAVALLLGWRWALPPKLHNLLGVGALSGLLGGSTAISGPPVILFFANLDKDKRSFRGNLVAYFILLNVGAIAVYFFAGLYTNAVLSGFVRYLLPLLAGTVVGMWLAGRANEQVFKRAVLIAIAAMGVGLAIAGWGAV